MAVRTSLSSVRTATTEGQYGAFAAERSRGKNRQTGEQMTHGDMLNKENSNLVALFNMSQCVICSPVWQFVPRDRSAAKGSFLSTTRASLVSKLFII